MLGVFCPLRRWILNILFPRNYGRAYVKKKKKLGRTKIALSNFENLIFLKSRDSVGENIIIPPVHPNRVHLPGFI